MPALQVKDFPQPLYDELKACASAEDRSMSQQVIRIVREYLDEYNGRASRREVQVSSFPAVRECADRTLVEKYRNESESVRNARILRKKRTFERINSSEKVELPDELPDIAAVVREMRDERTERLISDVNDGFDYDRP